jgi:hypothetical protein
MATILTALILTPGDFIPFRATQKQLVGNQFASDPNMKQAVTCWLQSFDTDIFYTITQALSPKCDKCSNGNGECVESGVYHLLHTYHRSQKKSLGIRVFVTSFSEASLYFEN